MSLQDSTPFPSAVSRRSVEAREEKRIRIRRAVRLRCLCLQRRWPNAIPTIGIGAGGGTDGQALVCHDLLRISAGTSPRFVEQYADLHKTALEAVGHYVNDVRSRAFPATRHTYAIADDELAQFEAKLPAVAR